MFKQPCIQNKLVLFHAIVCHFLVNNTVPRGFAEKRQGMEGVRGCHSILGCFFIFNPLTTNVPYHIETSQLICSANQLTAFYMMGSTGY